MDVKRASALAQQWLSEQGNAIPGFVGAFTHGSINWLSPDAMLPSTSDFDIMLVMDENHLKEKPGKFIYHGLLLECSTIPLQRIADIPSVLADHHLAGSFARAAILADRAGILAGLQAAVAGDYANRKWVVSRCENARGKILDYVDTLNTFKSFDDQVMGWIFATGICTHVLLVAGLMNPTVRKRYVAVRELLDAYRESDFYSELLALLGGGHLLPEQVAAYLDALGAMFDAAASVENSPFPYSSDISHASRPISIEGSREMIDAGNHREAIFWLAVTYTRCRKILSYGALLSVQRKSLRFADVQQRFEPDYRRFLAELGITRLQDVLDRTETLRTFLPDLWAKAEAIMAANPAIED